MTLLICLFHLSLVTNFWCFKFYVPNLLLIFLYFKCGFNSSSAPRTLLHGGIECCVNQPITINIVTFYGLYLNTYLRSTFKESFMFRELITHEIHNEENRVICYSVSHIHPLPYPEPLYKTNALHSLWCNIISYTHRLNLPWRVIATYLAEVNSSLVISIKQSNHTAEYNTFYYFTLNCSPHKER